MSVRYRSSSVQMNVAGTSTNSITVTKPNQTADGDLMVAVVTGPVNTVTAPSGWLRIGSFNGTLLQAQLWTKTASSEGANYVWGFSTSDTCGVSITSFIGGRDLHVWDVRGTGVSNPATGRALEAARDSVGFTVFAWQDNATATISWTQGAEKFDSVSNDTAGTRFRGMSATYYGPPDITDIVNTGDLLPGANATQSQAVGAGLVFSILIDSELPDAEPWDETNGHFDVELKLDRIEKNQTGGITTRFAGDVSGLVQTIDSSPSTGGLALVNDGLISTYWFSNTPAAWLEYDFGVGVTKTIRRYRLTCSPDLEDRDPRDWTLQGSNDGVGFTVLDTRVGEAFGVRGEVREFRVADPGDYRYYRIDVTQNASGNVSTVTRIAEFRLSTIDEWENITPFVNYESKIRITRGLQSSSGRSDFSRAYVDLNNTDGRFSTRNQSGLYYGALQRNNEMRISKAFGTKSLQLQGAVKLAGADMCGDGIRTPIRTTLAQSGDFEIRIDFEPESWRDQQHLAGVAVAFGEAEPWKLLLLDDGRLQFTRTTSVASYGYTSTAAIPVGGRQSVKVTLDVDNGAGASAVAFWYSDSINGTYTQIGSTVTQATTAATLFAGGALCVGHIGSLTGRGIHGLVYGWQFRSSIGGTIISELDFSTEANGSYTWTENSNVWAAINNAISSNRRWRFHGEVSEWPVAWDKTGTWITAAATGAGVQKRLERGNSPASAMRRYHTKGIISDPGAFERFATPYAYWPMEDKLDTFLLASGLPEKGPMQIIGNPDWSGADGGKFRESDELIKINGARYGGKVSGNPSGYADIRWMLYAPTVIPNSTNVMDVYTTGDIARFQITHESANNWRIRGYDEDDDGVVFWDTGNFAVSTTGELMHMQLILEQTGANVQPTLYAYDVYGTLLGSYTGVPFAGATLRRVHRININSEGLLVNAYIGHLAVYGRDSPTFAGGEMNAWQYESAGGRIQRLCYEEEIEFRHVGAISESMYMGFQTVDNPFPLMSTASVSDDGFLIDPLDVFGIEYRTNRSLFNQQPSLTLSYSGNELSDELQPVADDAYLANDFTANRGGAGSARAQRTDGPLSVSPPPSGVGPYERTQSYSLANDAQCTDIASWHVHLGTVDEDRYPRITVALENLRVAADPVLTEEILKMDVGKYVTVTDTPDFLPDYDIRQQVVGYEEWFDQFQHNIKMNALPARPYDIAQYDMGDRFAGAETYVGIDIGPTDTTATIVTDTGPKWSTSAAPFDVVINGERITVTSISNTTNTTTSDSFNRANSATVLGSTDGGTVQAWSTIGTWGINGNAAYISVAVGGSIATLAAAADFSEVAVSVPSFASGEAWLVFRADAGATNRLRFGGTVGTDAAAQVIVASAITRTETADATGNSFVLAAGDRLSARASGSVIECFVNGKLALVFTDTTHQTQTRVGIQTSTTVPRFDNFSFSSALNQQDWSMVRSVNGVTGYHKRLDLVELYRPPYRGI